MRNGKVMMKMRLELEKYVFLKYIEEADQEDHEELEILLERFRGACLRDSLPGVAESDLSLHQTLGRSSF